MSEFRASRQLPTLSILLLDFRLLLALFVGFRLMLAMVYQPYTFEAYRLQDGVLVRETFERGLSAFGDFQYYFQFAEVVHEGNLPYRDWWFEFPPVWISLFSGLYELLDQVSSVTFQVWARALGLILLVFDIGNLYLLRRLATRMYDPRSAMALAWIYALLGAPVIFSWWNFEPIVLFTMLLSLTCLLEGRDGSSALATIVGTLTKYIPILILPMVWKFYDRRRALRYTAITGAGVAVVLLALVAWGGKMATASLASQFAKASYQTVWALIDGNMRTGSFPGPQTRFDADNAFEPYGNSPTIPLVIRSFPFVVVGLYLFMRRMRRDDHTLVAFFTLTIVLFFLWAHGWSVQWVLILMPLLLLNFPTRAGVLTVLMLTLIGFVEYPNLFMRTAATDGEITGGLVAPYVLMVILRTTILVAVATALFRRLIPGTDDHAANDPVD